MSPIYFAESFKRAFGMAPHQFVATKRIEAAKALLTTTLPITEIAYRAGYEDASHFTQLFKRMTGQIPGGFRR